MGFGTAISILLHPCRMGMKIIMVTVRIGARSRQRAPPLPSSSVAAAAIPPLVLTPVQDRLSCIGQIFNLQEGRERVFHLAGRRA